MKMDRREFIGTGIAAGVPFFFTGLKHNTFRANSMINIGVIGYNRKRACRRNARSVRPRQVRSKDSAGEGRARFRRDEKTSRLNMV